MELADNGDNASPKRKELTVSRDYLPAVRSIKSMSVILTAAAIAQWLEDSPQAAAEVICHIGEDKAKSLLALEKHYPEEFGRAQVPKQYDIEQAIADNVAALVSLTDKQCARQVVRAVITSQLTN